MNTLQKIEDAGHGLPVSVGSSESSDEWSYKEAGQESKWTGQFSLGTTFRQFEDIELKKGGYDHADPQMIDLGGKILLVYVDEDSSIEGDDRTVLRYQIFNKGDGANSRWLAVPGEIRAVRDGKTVNGALEPNLTDAGDKLLITWSAVTLPDSDHSDSEYMQDYLRGRDVYAAVVDKAQLRDTSATAPMTIDGALVSSEGDLYDTSPSGMYCHTDKGDSFTVSYLTSEAHTTEDPDSKESILEMSTPTLNISYIKTASYNSETGKWETSFGVMKLNSTYNAQSGTWTPISGDDNLPSINNPTVIDLDSSTWGDWAIYTFAVDEDNNISTDEDREIFVKLENIKTGNATVNQLTHDGAYTDNDGVEHQGISKSRPQLVQAKGTVYLFWQQGSEDVAWLDLGELITNKADQDTGVIDTENMPIKMVFYPTYGAQVTPTYANFKPFVDELDNLYLVGIQSVSEDDKVKQELYASLLKSEE